MTRPSEPWEFSDGAVYLVRELCAVKPEIGVGFFEEMAEIARLTHFVQADCLRETIWKQVKLFRSTSLGLFPWRLMTFCCVLRETVVRCLVRIVWNTLPHLRKELLGRIMQHGDWWRCWCWYWC